VVQTPAVANCAEQVELLVAMQADVNAADVDGDTSLHMAAGANNSTIIPLLVRLKADINAQNKSLQTPMHVCIPGNRFKSINELLRLGSNPNICDDHGCSVLYRAAESHLPYIMERLIESKADINLRKTVDQSTAVHVLARNGRIETLQLLLEHRGDASLKDHPLGSNALHMAVYGDYAATVETIIKYSSSSSSSSSSSDVSSNSDNTDNCQVHENNYQSQHQYSNVYDRRTCNSDNNNNKNNSDSSGSNSRTTTGSFFSNTFGQGKTERHMLINALDASGMTPLHLAAITNKPFCLRSLINSRARLDGVDRDGSRLLHHLVKDTSTVILTAILSHPWIKVDDVDVGGNSALHWAVKYNEPYSIMSLLRAKANPDLLNVSYETPRIWAKKSGNNQLIRLFEDQKYCEEMWNQYNDS
jgi:ankyrin repeat protein